MPAGDYLQARRSHHEARDIERFLMPEFFQITGQYVWRRGMNIASFEPTLNINIHIQNSLANFT
jgi:hypothetical protein